MVPQYLLPPVNLLADQPINKHATYRNPENPEQYWYAPDASGNPPKWIKDAVGSKPDREKDPKQYEAWVKKLEKYRVNGKDTKKEAT